jgi:hypothetical protein
MIMKQLLNNSVNRLGISPRRVKFILVGMALTGATLIPELVAFAGRATSGTS